MSTIKKFTDRYGDTLELDTELSTDSVYVGTFERGAGSSCADVELDVAKVISVRKALKKWLIENGHIKPKALKPELGLVLTFDDEDEHTILAVTLQDAEGRIREVIWER